MAISETFIGAAEFIKTAFLILIIYEVIKLIGALGGSRGAKDIGNGINKGKEFWHNLQEKLKQRKAEKEAKYKEIEAQAFKERDTVMAGAKSQIDKVLNALRRLHEYAKSPGTPTEADRASIEVLKKEAHDNFEGLADTFNKIIDSNKGRLEQIKTSLKSTMELYEFAEVYDKSTQTMAQMLKDLDEYFENMPNNPQYTEAHRSLAQLRGQKPLIDSFKSIVDTALVMDINDAKKDINDIAKNTRAGVPLTMAEVAQWLNMIRDKLGAIDSLPDKTKDKLEVQRNIEEMIKQLGMLHARAQAEDLFKNFREYVAKRMELNKYAESTASITQLAVDTATRVKAARPAWKNLQDNPFTNMDAALDAVIQAHQEVFQACAEEYQAFKKGGAS